MKNVARIALIIVIGAFLSSFICQEQNAHKLLSQGIIEKRSQEFFDKNLMILK